MNGGTMAIRKLIEQIERREGQVMDVVKVRIVDGNAVRNDHVEFTLGGHQRVWPYIPEDEIWVEAGVMGDDRVATICHEQVERTVMKLLRWDYERAHELANQVEVILRDKISNKKA